MLARVLMLELWAAALVTGMQAASRVGIYHWGGRPAHSVSEGVEAIADLGGRVARIALSARYYRDYNVSPNCISGFALTSAAQDPDLKRAFDNPAIDVLIVTVYDGVTFGDCENFHALNPAFFTPARTSALVQEYSDFTLYLYRTYQNTHKRFILSNWESDNTVYCGHAHKFATNPEFRAGCLAQYPALFGVESPNEGLEGMKLWMQARARGVMDGRSRAQAENIGGMRVYIAPEFCIVRALHDRGFPSVLYDVLPHVMFDYVSYSAWESINEADPAAALLADLDTIQKVIGSDAIIVGESGYVREVAGGNTARTGHVMSAALAWGVAFFVQWRLYDDPPDTFGLYDNDGKPTPLADWFRTRFEQDASELSRVRIRPAVDRTRGTG